jgi:alcohol dehydrogenase class IV
VKGETLSDENVARSYEYTPPEARKIVGGLGALSKLGELAEDLGTQKAVVVTSPSLVREQKTLRQVEELLDYRYLTTFSGVKPHSPIDTVKQVTQLVQDSDADTVVSLGGGSSIDTAKGVVWYSNPDGEDATIKHIAIPSTLSGAEYTTDAGITFPDGKRVHRHPRIVPPGVILDPNVVATVPLEFLKTSLLNALAHCLEGLVSIGASPMTDASYTHGIRLLNDSHTRLDTDQGRYLAQGGAALAAIHQVPVGLAHALVHIVGGKFKTPHAATHAIVGPAVMRFNLPYVASRQRAIAESFGIATAGLTDHQAAWEAVKAARGIATNLGVPAGLRDLGVPEDRLLEVAEEVPHDPCFITNPKEIDSPEETMTALRWAWSGEIPAP